MTKKIKFLLIDDDHIFNFVNTKFIEKADSEHEVVSYESPLKAFAYLKNIDIDLLPDILFLDINMPELNGFEFLDKLIKERSEVLEHTNIFIITSSLNPYDFEKSKKYEFLSGYYNKPIDLEKMITTINWFYNKNLKQQKLNFKVN